VPDRPHRRPPLIFLAAALVEHQKTAGQQYDTAGKAGGVQFGRGITPIGIPVILAIVAYAVVGARVRGTHRAKY